MRRDMDLIRSLLLEIEGGKVVFPTAEQSGETEVLEYHLDLIAQAGFVDFIVLHDLWQVERMTWAGHEFVDKVRDPEIWRQTKASAAKVGQWSIKALADIAVSIGKARIEHLFATGQIGG